MTVDDATALAARSLQLKLGVHTKNRNELARYLCAQSLQSLYAGGESIADLPQIVQCRKSLNQHGAGDGRGALLGASRGGAHAGVEGFLRSSIGLLE
jgi:hypothetical protein